MTETFDNFLTIIAAIGLLYGFAQCFSGWQIFKVTLLLTGFVIGFIFGGILGISLEGGEPGMLLAAFVGGIIGSVLVYSFFFVGLFIIGALWGALTISVLLSSLNYSPHIIVVFLFAIIGGIAALVFQKFVIVLSTSINGAWGIVTGINHFVKDGPPVFGLNPLLSSSPQHLRIMLLCTVALAVVGFFVQYKQPDNRGSFYGAPERIVIPRIIFTLHSAYLLMGWFIAGLLILMVFGWYSSGPFVSLRHALRDLVIPIIPVIITLRTMRYVPDIWLIPPAGTEWFSLVKLKRSSC
jgi:hypothetical protein